MHLVPARIERLAGLPGDNASGVKLIRAVRSAVFVQHLGTHKKRAAINGARPGQPALCPVEFVPQQARIEAARNQSYDDE